METRNIIIAYNMIQADRIAHLNQINIYNCIIFTHAGMKSNELYYDEKNQCQLRDNFKFITKLQKLRGYAGKFIFYFDNNDSYEYETNRLFDLLHTLFSCTLWQHIDRFEPEFQELYLRIKEDM